EIRPRNVGNLLTVAFRGQDLERPFQRGAADVRSARLDLGMNGVMELLGLGGHIGLAASRWPGLLGAMQHEDPTVPDRSPRLLAIAPDHPADLLTAADVHPGLPG